MKSNHAKRIVVPDKWMQGGLAGDSQAELAYRDAREAPFAVHGLAAPRAGWGRLTGVAALPAGLEADAALSSGGKVSFVSETRRIMLRVRWGEAPLLVGMPQTGSHGIDLYVGEGQRCLYHYVTMQYDGAPFLIYEDLQSPRAMRSFTLNLPLFAPVESLEIGIDADAAIAAPERATGAPIVVYGGENAQGRGASRPGMAWCSILERRLNRPVLNLGCHACPSDAAGAPELARLLASAVPDAALFLLHFEELCPDRFAAMLAPFVAALHAAAPRAAIVVLSATPAVGLVAREQSMRRRNREAAREVAAASAGTIDFLDGNTILGTQATECLIDGRHLSDLGQMRLATALVPRVARILRRRP